MLQNKDLYDGTNWWPCYSTESRVSSMSNLGKAYFSNPLNKEHSNHEHQRMGEIACQELCMNKIVEGEYFVRSTIWDKDTISFMCNAGSKYIEEFDREWLKAHTLKKKIVNGWFPKVK
jgi:hypothetical protein